MHVQGLSLHRCLFHDHCELFLVLSAKKWPNGGKKQS